jgi:hypothetical protein
VAVHGRDKYLNLLACGGVALGSQQETSAASNWRRDASTCVASKQQLNRMAIYCPRTASSYHLPVPSALWRTGADQTAVQTRRLRIRRLGPTRRLIRELSGMDD